MKKYIVPVIAILVAMTSLGLITLGSAANPWSGASTERQSVVTVRSLAYYTTSDTTSLVTNWAYRGMRITYTATDTILTPGVTITLQGYNDAAAEYYTVLASASQTGEGTLNMHIYPGGPVTANVAANTVLPHFWRVVITHADGDSVKYGLKVEVIP